MIEPIDLNSDVSQILNELEEIDRLRVENAHLHTWAGLLSLLNEHCPVDEIGGEPSSQSIIAALTREVDRLRRQVTRMEIGRLQLNLCAEDRKEGLYKQQ